MKTGFIAPLNEGRQALAGTTRNWAMAKGEVKRFMPDNIADNPLWVV